MNKFRILIVDDEEDIRETLSTVLTEEGYETAVSSDGEDAIGRLEKGERYEVIFCDIRMPKADGFEVLKTVTRLCPETFFIAITAFGTLEAAIDALRKEAYDYIMKPLIFDDIIAKVKHLMDYRSVSLQFQTLKDEIEERFNFDNVIGQGKEMKEVYHLVNTASSGDSTILITGEIGTGKEIIAKSIHYNSSQREGRFLSVNCNNYSPDLLGRELFGSANDDSRSGLLFCTNGTIFLNEIGKLSVPLQARLLDAMGGKDPNGTINIRLIAATTQDLPRMIESGLFLEELYYRINSVEIKMPPLRQRRNDIPFLVKHFLRRLNTSIGKKIRFVDDEALEMLMTYGWPGNLRELSSVIEQAMILCDSEQEFITKRDLPIHIAEAEETTLSDATLKDATRFFERRHISAILRKYQRDKKESARALGLSLSSLYRKMDELEVTIH
ncbi:sigma-54-dependent transcriptional regulator [Bdellovibrionota bacterium]